MRISTTRIRQSLLRIVKAVSITAVVLYAILILMLYTYQRDLIFAGDYTQGLQSSQVTPVDGEELIHLSANGIPVSAIFAPMQPMAGTRPPATRANPTVIFFMGNGGCMADNMDIVKAIRQRGANALIVDYPGYGMSGGEPSEVGAYAAADSAYDYVAMRKGCDPNRIVAAGWSLGSSVATHLASTRPVAGLAVWSAFTNMAEEAHGRYPMVPTPLVRFMLKYPFPTETEIARVHAPIFMAHGTLDPVMPLSMPRRLMAVAGGPVTWTPIAGAHHNDIFDVGGARLFDKFAAWIAEMPARGHRSSRN